MNELGPLILGIVVHVNASQNRSNITARSPGATSRGAAERLDASGRPPAGRSSGSEGRHEVDLDLAFPAVIEEENVPECQRRRRAYQWGFRDRLACPSRRTRMKASEV
jgi:hypothetical protein